MLLRTLNSHRQRSVALQPSPSIATGLGPNHAQLHPRLEPDVQLSLVRPTLELSLAHASAMATRTVQTRTTQATTDQRTLPEDGVYRLDFGQHRGLTLNEAPASWVRWATRERVYEARPALRIALEQGSWLKPGGGGDTAGGTSQRGGNSGRTVGGGQTRSSGAGGQVQKPGQAEPVKAFSGGGNVLGGTPADR